MRGLRTPLGRLLTLVVLVLMGVLLPATAASAHVDIDHVSPTYGEVVQLTPKTIVLDMSGPPGNIDVKLYHRDGRPVPLTGDGASIDGNTVTVTPPALDIGTYVLTWSSIGPDGHAAAGQTYFSVGVPDGVPGDFASGAVNQNPVQTGLEWLGYAGLAGAFGIAWLTLLGLVGRPRRAHLMALASAGILGAAELIRLLVVSATVGQGNVATGLSQVVSAPVTIAGWLLIATGALVALLLTRKPVIVLAATVVVAFGDILTGHLGSNTQWLILVPLAAVHLLAVCLWLGGPAAHLIAGRTGKPAHFAFAGRFTPWALGAFVAVAASGVALVAMRAGLDNVLAFFNYRYGETLLAKWAILLLLILPLGAYHGGRILLGKASEYQDKLDEQTRTEKAGAEPEPAPANDPEDWLAEAVTASADDAQAPAPKEGFRRALSPVTLAVEAVALLLVLALGASLAGLPATPPAGARVLTAAEKGGTDLLAAPKTFEECLGSPNELLCMSQYFAGVAEDKGMPVALAEVTNRWKNGDSWMQKNCHAIGHKLGRLGYRMFQDIKTAFSQGSDPCDYGYLHGVIEGASADFTDDQLKEAMPTMCNPIGDLTVHTYRQCIHGLGHAAARRVNNDLGRGMEFCDVFYDKNSPVTSDMSKETDQQIIFGLCVTGVSMEWNTQPKALDALKLPIGADGTLMGECLKLPERFQSNCIEYGTSAMGGILKREIEAREWCDANLKDSLPCYMSIGRDVIWSTSITPQQAVDVCMGGKPGIYAETCLMRALGSVATISLNAKSIDDWCPNLPEQYRYLCPIVRDAMKVQIEQTTRGFILDNTTGASASPSPSPTKSGNPLE